MSDPKTSSSDELETDPRIGSLLAERYRIDALIGEGGMGKVYAAEHVLMRKKLAVKVLHRELTTVADVVSRFKREAMAAAHIDNPHVAAATDFGKLPDGAVFLVLEYIDGRGLRDAIDQGPIAVERALHIARQIAVALASAHALGIVHRDLKPENVMLVQKGDDADFVKVLDFGIARVPIGEVTGRDVRRPSDGPITRAGMVFGTPEYMAPEQALGQTADGRADLFSLGIILFEMLSGVRPFVAGTAIGILGQQLSKPPPTFKQLAPEVSVPREVEALVVRLLAREAHDRFQTANDVNEALSLCLGLAPPRSPTPLPSSPPPPWEPNARDTDLNLHSPSFLPGDPLPRFATSETLANQDLGDLLQMARRPAAPPAAAPSPAAIPSPTALAPSAALKAAPSPPAPPARLQPTPNAEASGTPQPGARPSSTRQRVRLAGAGLMLALLGAGVLLFRFKGTPSEVHDVPAPAVTPEAKAALPEPPKREAKREVEPRRELPPPSVSVAPVSVGPLPTDRAGLERLVQAEPTNTRAATALAKAYAADKEYEKAAAAVQRLLGRDPSLNSDPVIATVLFQTVQAKPARDLSFTLLSGSMGARGADILYDLAVDNRIHSSVRDRANEALKSAEFLRVASDSLQLAVRLREAKTCEARLALVKRAHSQGDARSLPYLDSFRERTGCGADKNEDCYVCMRADATLDDAVDAIKARDKG